MPCNTPVIILLILLLCTPGHMVVVNPLVVVQSVMLTRCIGNTGSISKVVVNLAGITIGIVKEVINMAYRRRRRFRSFRRRGSAGRRRRGRRYMTIGYRM